MRDFLDEILSFIGSESLTDEEFDALTVETEELSKDVYLALRAVVEARDGVSNTAERLKYYFMAAGTDLGSSATPAKTPASNILIGTEL